MISGSICSVTSSEHQKPSENDPRKDVGDIMSESVSAKTYLDALKKKVVKDAKRIEELEKTVAEQANTLAVATAAIDQLGKGAQFIESSTFLICIPMIADHVARYRAAEDAGDETLMKTEEDALNTLLQTAGRLDPENFARVYHRDPVTGEELPE